MTCVKKISTALLAIAFSSAIFATSVHAAEEKVLNVYNWIDYVAADTIANFEKETGIKVNYQTYEDNDTLDEILHDRKSNYDLVVPSSDWAKSQIDSGLYQKLDKTKLTNYKNLDVSYLEILKDADPSNVYLAGYLWVTPPWA